MGMFIDKTKVTWGGEGEMFEAGDWLVLVTATPGPIHFENVRAMVVRIRMEGDRFGNQAAQTTVNGFTFNVSPAFSGSVRDVPENVFKLAQPLTQELWDIWVNYHGGVGSGVRGKTIVDLIDWAKTLPVMRDETPIAKEQP